MKGGGSSKNNMVTFSNQFSKKHHVDGKHCILYKQHGGAHNTQNTMEFCKYEKDGTPKMSFAGDGAKRNPHSRNSPEICHASRTIATCSCPLRSEILKNTTRSSSTQTKSASLIMTVTATTWTHPEEWVW
jgi:hypothetical protein